MQKPKIKLQIVIFLEFRVVFTVSSFMGNPVLDTYHNICHQMGFWTAGRCQNFLKICHLSDSQGYPWNIYLWNNEEKIFFSNLERVTVITRKLWNKKTTFRLNYDFKKSNELGTQQLCSVNRPFLLHEGLLSAK